jgi:ribonucleoside-diphosphate reductase alpha chain
MTALDISPHWHIHMQAAFQKYTDNAVSKTINFPQETSREDILEAFRQAHELGCKGLTVYRVGSREEQVLVVGREEEEAPPAEPGVEWGRIRPVSRTSRLRGITVRKATPMGNLFLTLNMHRTHPFELFAQIGKAGSDVAAFTEGIARLISLAFRCGVDPQAVADQLIGIGGSRSVGFGPNRIRSVPDAIGQFIQQYIESDTHFADEDEDDDALTQLDLADLAARKVPAPSGGEQAGSRRYALCPACGLNAVIYQEGCVYCLACGYTEC